MKQCIFTFILAFTSMHWAVTLSETQCIYCLSTPRSLSTVFYKAMENRGDCAVLNEPGVQAYTAQFEPEAYDIIATPHDPRTFDEAIARIGQLQNSHKIVFVKEMGFAAKQYLFSVDLENCVYSPVIVLFLVRNPHAALASLYNKRPELFPVLEDWMSYEDMWKLFVHTCNSALYHPYVIIAEDLAQDPVDTIKKFCDFCEISFDEKSLHWDRLSDSMPSDHPWNNDVGHLWFSDLLQSTGFCKPHAYDVDAAGEPTFIEIHDIDHRAVYQQLYTRNKPYYERFVALRIPKESK